jgi:hypothetical protein
MCKIQQSSECRKSNGITREVPLDEFIAPSQFCGLKALALVLNDEDVFLRSFSAMAS